MTAFVIIVIGYLTYTLNGPVYTTAHTVSIKILKKSIYIIFMINLFQVYLFQESLSFEYQVSIDKEKVILILLLGFRES